MRHISNVLRHYTSRANMEKILAEQKLTAKRGKIYFTRTSTRGSPIVVAKKLGIDENKAKAFIDVDVTGLEVKLRKNPKTEHEDLIVEGSIDLRGRIRKVKL